MKRLFDMDKLKNNGMYILVLFIIALLLIIVNFFVDKKEDANAELQDDEAAYHSLVINEIMISNTGALVDSNGNTSDWLEIYNGSSKDIDLTNYGLSDVESGNIKWKFPKVTIKSNEYLLIYLTGKNKGNTFGDLNVNFSLNKKGGEIITLKNAKGKVIDSVKTLELDKNASMIRDKNGNWEKTLEITPGYSNNKKGREAYLKSFESDEDLLIISEILPRNKGNYIKDGILDEYVEIENSSNKTINLGDYYLSNDVNVPFKWKLPEKNLKPDEVYLVLRSEMNSNSDKNFHIDNTNGVVLLSSNNKIIDKVEYSNLTNGYGYIKSTNDFIASINISPGYYNDSKGVKDFNKNRTNPKELIINEVINYNKKYLPQDGNYYDLIELYNNTDNVINLSDYEISDDIDKLDKMKLPNIEIKPNEYYILYASGNVKLTKKGYTHLNFKISADEGLYLSKNNILVDSLFVPDMKQGYSYGRGTNSGVYFYSEPTPNKKNNTKSVLISTDPIFSVKPGIYDKSVSVKIYSIGDIYYTLDGSIPNKNSKKYSKEIKIDKTTVIRTRAYENGKESSNVVTGTYIIGEKHTLPVLSISLPDSSFDELYEKDTSFSIDCGMKLFGGQTRYIPKKSFALKFSSKYGPSKLKYKVFDRRTATKYDTLVVRSGSQDSVGSMFRDELATSIMNDYGTVDVQDYKATILYINGKYWGIYFLREKVDEDFVSSHYNVDEKGTNIVRIDNVVSSGSSTDYNELLSYVKSHDMSSSSSYEWVSKHLDIENFIDYLIGELYTTNNDIVNTRFFNNPKIDNGKIKMIFYDFDYAFYNYDRDYLGWLTNSSGMGDHHYNNALIIGLMKNKKFKTKFLERLSYNMKNVWADKIVKKRYNELYDMIEPEIKRDQKRWNRSYSDWEKECKILKTYIDKRRSNLLKNVKSYFKLSDKEMKEYFD